MSLNQQFRDAAEFIAGRVEEIIERGGEYTDQAQMYTDELWEALQAEDAGRLKKAVRGIFGLFRFADFGTQSEYLSCYEKREDLPEDLQAQIAADVREETPDEGQVLLSKTADQFTGNPMRFVWYPFIPCGEYAILGASGGSGKGMCACLIAAYLSHGYPLPEERPCPDALRAYPWEEPQDVLIISSEDTGDEIQNRLTVSRADLSRVHIIDKDHSAGLDLSTGAGLAALKKEIIEDGARLVIIDPMQAFIGGETDMNRAAKMRNILAGISHLAGATNCGIVLIAHTSKKLQETDLNGGILGSVETVNAARSVMCVMRDPEDEDPRTNKRLLIHTKANNARLGRSIRFEIIEEKRDIDGESVPVAGGRFADDLYSDVTKELFEESVRRRVSARELITMKKHEETELDELIDAIKDKADELRKEKKTTKVFPYDDFPSLSWAGKRPKDAIDKVKYKVIGAGIALAAPVDGQRKDESGKPKHFKGVRITLTR